MLLFKNRYGELRSGWSVAAVLVLIVIGQTVGSALIPDSGGEIDIALKVIITLLYSLIMIGGGLLLFRLLYKRNPRQMGLIPEGWLSGLLHGFGIGILSMGLVFAALLLSGQAEVTGMDMARLLTLGILIELISVGLTAFSEELLTRGYIMTAFKTTRNAWIIFLAPAILFSLAHILNPGITILSLANTFLAGLLFAYMFVKTGKLWLPAGFHIAWNFTQGDILGMNVSGNEQAAIFATKLGTNEFLAGGNYGPEGGLLVTCVLLLVFLYVRFVVKAPGHPIWTVSSDLPLTREAL